MVDESERCEVELFFSCICVVFLRQEVEVGGRKDSKCYEDDDDISLRGRGG
jgi:hypothetical protein